MIFSDVQNISVIGTEIKKLLGGKHEKDASRRFANIRGMWRHRYGLPSNPTSRRRRVRDPEHE